jgi:hypothetical protein
LEESLFWAQAYFLRERAIFGVRTIGGRKEACINKRKKQHAKGRELA